MVANVPHSGVAHHGAIKATRRRRIKMKDEIITVMILRAGEFMAEVKTIPHELKAMQELVGGCFDIVRGEYMLPPALQNSVLAKYDIFVNDEGIMKGLEPNVCLNPEAALEKDYDKAGLLFGDLFIAGHDTEGDTVSIDRFDIMPLRWLLARHMLMNKSRKDAMQHD